MKFLIWFKSFFLQSKKYWSVKNRVQSIKFSIFRLFYSYHFSYREENLRSKNLNYLIRISFRLILTSFLIAILLQVIDSYLFSFFSYKTYLQISADNYVTLLATISGIGGIFIGLYFTAISVVASTVYARVPSKIRNLLAKERTGNVYIRFLSLLTFVCLILIGINLLGFTPQQITIIPILLFTGVGIFSFIYLGKGSFYLFDPTSLSKSIFQDLLFWIDKATVGSGSSLFWDKSSFQRYFKHQSLKLISSLEDLANVCQREDHLKEDPQEGLSENLAAFLSVYVTQKKRIPSNSEWFDSKLQQKDWYKSPYFEISSALKTGTQLQPNVERNHYWVEDILEGILIDFVHYNLKEERYDILVNQISSYKKYIGSLGEEGEVERAINFFSKINKAFINHLIQKDGESQSKNKTKILGAVDLVCLLPIELLISYCEKSKYRKVDYFETKIRSIKWAKEGAVYKSGLNFYLLERLEWLRDSLKFEKEIENDFKSPLWYQVELVTQIEAEKIITSINKLLMIIEDFYDSSYQSLIDNHKYLLSAALISRKIEYVNKVRLHLDNVISQHQDLTNNKSIEKLPWKEIDLERIRTKYSSKYNEIASQASQICSYFVLRNNPEDFPDYHGQFLSIIEQYLYEASLEHNESIFATNFSAFFYASLSKHNYLRPTVETPDWKIESTVMNSTHPVMDLMNLSGYVLLFSELHRNENLWKEVKKVWDKYLYGIDDTSQFIEQLANMININDTSFAITDRGTIRTNRKQLVSNELNELLDMESFPRPGMSFTQIRIPSHESALVRLFTPKTEWSTSIPYDGIDIFIHLYLKVEFEKDKKSFDFGLRGQNQFCDSLQRQIDLYKEYIGGNEEE